MPEPMSKTLKIRLQNEYNRFLEVPKTRLYDWKAAPGETVPYVKNYIITYHIRTLVQNKDGGLEWQNETTVKISKASIREPWAVVVTEGKVPYHPNWWPHGSVCRGNGMDNPEMWLYEAVNFVGRLLQFQPDVINPNSPANVDANNYWLKHKNDKDASGKRIFPTDSTVFPLPGSKGETLKPKITIKKVTHSS